MRVGIATVHTPGIYGGAEFLVDGLVEAVRAAGHSVHKISMPFYFEPVDAAAHTMDQALGANYLPFNGGRIDRMICLKFPAYMLRHPDKRVWLLHQHRAAYDLYGTPYGWLPGKPETDALREDIIAGDNESLAVSSRDRHALSSRLPSASASVCAISTRSSPRRFITRLPTGKNSAARKRCPTSSCPVAWKA